MYLVFHESRNSDRRYIVEFDVKTHLFSVEDENHNIIEVNENTLFRAIDKLIKREA